jgi:DNA modification methylase
MRRPIVNNSAEGDAVYDPFVGSFTTGIACEMTGRRCYAMEITPAFANMAIARWCRALADIYRPACYTRGELPSYGERKAAVVEPKADVVE